MAARRRTVSSGGTPDPGDESGFSLVESLIALSLVFAVLVVLLGGLTAGARGLIAGRQRGVAVSLANSVFENARGRDYDQVGHDFDSDPTLATDPLITGASPNQFYSGVTPAEPLAGSSVDAGAAGGSNSNPLYPFSPHRSTTTKDGTSYTTTVYVTTVTPVSGDSYKRISVTITWAPAQYATAARSVEMSTFLYDAIAPPDPRLTGQGEADAGTFTVCPVSTDPCILDGIDLSQVRLSLPYVSGSVDSGFIKTAKGTANSGSSTIDLLSGAPVGAGCDVLGLSVSCAGAKADASADNDTGTAPPDTDQEGPVSSLSKTSSVDGVLSVTLGGGSAQAQATGRSCWACQAGGTPNVGDDDMLPFFYGNATGPASLNVALLSGLVTGSLLSVGTGCAVNCATVTVDRDETGGSATLTSTATVNYPAMKIMTLDGLLTNGMVQVSAGNATATAASGPGTGAPSLSGSGVTVQLWDGAGYQSYTVTPGMAQTGPDPEETVTIPLGLDSSVTMTARLHWNDEVTSSSGPVNGFTEKSASLNNWLYVEVRTVITVLGVPITDLKLHLDLGRIAAKATYQEVP